MAGHEVGGLRLPLVEASDDETRGDPRGARAPRPTGAGLTKNGTLRVLPLGGLGEIGKNMTVVEYDGRIVVVDTGLMFPTPDQLGIDLVLPDFAYLRERADDVEAIVLTHGHEDHVGALPFLLRQFDRAPAIYGGPLTAAMVRSKLDEHKLRDVQVEDVLAGGKFDAGPFARGDGEDGPLDPGRIRGGAHLRARHDARDRRLQVRPDSGGRRAGRRRATRRDRARRAAAPLRRLHERRPARHLALRVERRARASRRCSRRCEGRIVVTCFASNIHRVQQVVDAAAGLGRKVALVGRSMRKNVNIGRMLGHIEVPGGNARRPRRDRGLPRPQAGDPLHRQPGRAALGATPNGS